MLFKPGKLTSQGLHSAISIQHISIRGTFALSGVPFPCGGNIVSVVEKTARRDRVKKVN